MDGKEPARIVRSNREAVNMFDEHTEIHLKKISSGNHRNDYSLYSDESIIGTIREISVSSKVISRLAHSLLPLHAVELELQLLDANAKTLGTIRKERGFHKELFLYSENEEHIATLKPRGKIKSPKITVIDENGKDFMKADGNYGATDFSVIDSRINRQISYVKKRPFENGTMKERLQNSDVYYNLENNRPECPITFALITICVALDLYFRT